MRSFLRWLRRPPNSDSFRDYDDLDLKAFREHAAWIDIHLHDFGDPVYEYVDEGVFRPWDSEYPVPTSAVCLFHATLKSSSGRCFDGIVSHCPEEGPRKHAMIGHAPELVLNSGKTIRFWHGLVYGFGDQWLNEDRQLFYEETGLTPEDAFPMEYSVSPDVVEGGIDGMLPGFGYLKSANEVVFAT